MWRLFFFIPLFLFAQELALEENCSLVFTYDQRGQLFKTILDETRRPLYCQTSRFDPVEGRPEALIWIEPELDETGAPLGEPVMRLYLESTEQIAGFSEQNESLHIDLPLQALSHELLHCKGSIGNASADWVLSCGFWHKLQVTAEEERQGTLNLFDHLQELLPASGRRLGLLTYQNGIRTTFTEFIGACAAIAEKVPEGTLLIGLYNRSKGATRDILRLLQEIVLARSSAVKKMGHFLEEIATQLHEINPDSLWGHILHSEGGVITRRAIERLASEQQALLRQHLYLYALGSVLPIPESYAFYAMNVYSRDDFIGFASQLFGVGGYSLIRAVFGEEICHIHFIPSLAKWSEKTMFLIDHAFQGGTYGAALEEQIKKWRARYGLYDGIDPPLSGMLFAPAAPPVCP